VFKTTPHSGHQLLAAVRHPAGFSFLPGSLQACIAPLRAIPIHRDAVYFGGRSASGARE
jgi:hypothetical protein